MVKETFNLKKEIIIRSIKIIDIGYITIIYGIIALILAKLCNIFTGTFDESKEKTKSIYVSIYEVMLYLWFIGTIIYIARNLLPIIPFPLDGVYGFDHMSVKEVTNIWVFAILFLYFQEHYQSKIKYILNTF